MALNSLSGEEVVAMRAEDARGFQKAARVRRCCRASFVVRETAIFRLLLLWAVVNDEEWDEADPAGCDLGASGHELHAEPFQSSGEE